MQFAAVCIFLLALSEPLLIHAKKVVLLFPRQIRRSPVAPWRTGMVHYRKTSPGNDYHRHVYRAVPSPYPRKPFHKIPPYPHGGDDFDQGPENVNHVHIPYGKEISHAITMGKGYVPYDSIKGSFSLGNQRYPGPQGHRQIEPDYPSAPGFSSPGFEYNIPTGHSYDAPHMDSYFSDGEGGLDSHERRNDRKKFYSSRSIDKELGVRPYMDLNSPVEKSKEQQQQQQQHQQQQLLPQAPEMYKDSLVHGQDVQGTVILPAGGIPPTTIAGNKDGIVFRDTVALEEYHKQLQEMTKSWPRFLTGGAVDPAAELQQQLQSTVARFPTAGLPGSSFTGPAGWVSEFAQPKQGYAVKEDLAEPDHDFRNMPIQTTSFQSLPLTMNVNMPHLTQPVHG